MAEKDEFNLQGAGTPDAESVQYVDKDDSLSIAPDETEPRRTFHGQPKEAFIPAWWIKSTDYSSGQVDKTKHDSINVVFVAVMVVAYICCVSSQAVSFAWEEEKKTMNLYMQYDIAVPFSPERNTVLLFANYFLQGIVVVYICSSLCRHSLRGKLFHVIPRVWPKLFFISYSLSFILGIARLRAFVANDVIWSAILCVVWLDMVFFSLVVYLQRSLSPPIVGSRVSSKWDRGITQFLLPNAMAVYAAWIYILFLENITICVKFYTQDSGKLSSYLYIFFLAVTSIALTVIEIRYFDKYLRYVMGHHFVLLNNVVGILAGIEQVYNGDPDSDILVLSATAVTISVLLMFAKCGVGVMRREKEKRACVHD